MVVLLNGREIREETCSQIYLTVISPTTLTAAGTYYKLEGTTATYVLQGDFINLNNRITYIGSRIRHFDCIIPFSMSSNKKDIDVTFEIYKNGSGEILASRIKRTLRVVDDIYVMCLAATLKLEQNDYVELWASASIDDVIVTLKTMSFLVCD